MTRPTTYRISALRLTGLVSPAIAVGREAAFRLTDWDWQLVTRDSGSSLSCGLLTSRLSVEALDRRSCRLSIEGLPGFDFRASIVLEVSAPRLQQDLDERQASLERARLVEAAILAGQWWQNKEVFESLDWSRRRSIAGIHYRSGWWGTGKLKPTMLAKVLDFGPRGVSLRGLRILFLIPWDAIHAIGVAPGDAWLYAGGSTQPHRPVGSTIVLRSTANQDAAFFTPLLQPPAVRAILDPFATSLDASDMDLSPLSSGS